MSRSRTLLERLESPGPKGSRRVGGDLPAMRDSIRRHLQQLLNSTHGGSESAPGYGIPGFTDYFHGAQSLRELEVEIQHAITRYEPRLTDVQVRFEVSGEQSFDMRFDITASVVTGDGEKRAVFRSVVEPSGHVHVGRG